MLCCVYSKIKKRILFCWFYWKQCNSENIDEFALYIYIYIFFFKIEEEPFLKKKEKEKEKKKIF